MSYEATLSKLGSKGAVSDGVIEENERLREALKLAMGGLILFSGQNPKNEEVRRVADFSVLICSAILLGKAKDASNLTMQSGMESSPEKQKQVSAAVDFIMECVTKGNFGGDALLTLATVMLGE